MSLTTCIQKLNKNSLSLEDKQELMRRVAEHNQTMDRPAAEKAAVDAMLDEARANHDYLAEEIKKEMGTQAPVQATDEPENMLQEAAPIDIAKEPPAEPLGADPSSIKASTTDAVTSVAHAMAEKYVGPTGNKIVADVSHILKTLVGSMESLRAVVTRVTPHLPSARVWHDALMAKEATKGELERRLENIAQIAGKLDTKSYDRANEFIAKSTVEQKWGHQPEGFGRAVPIDPKFAAEFNALTPEEKALVDATFKHSEDMRIIEQHLHKQLGSSGLFATRGQLDGPYAHLDRPGGFVTTLKSRALLDAEKALRADGSNANIAAVEKLKEDAKNYQVHMFDTPGQADQFARANKGKYAFSEASTKMIKFEDSHTMDPRVLQRVMSAVGANKEMPPEARKAMEDSVRAMWLSAIDQNSARQAQQNRQNIAGFNKDITRSTLTHGRAQAAYIANLAHGAEINDAFYNMKNEIEHPTTRVRIGQDDFNLLAAHHLDSLKYNPTPIQDGVMAMTSAWQLATSLSYHLANFSQTVMVTLPRLAADFGAGNYTESWGHVMDGYKLMNQVTKDKGMTIDLSLVKDKGIREALEHAANSHLLDVGMTEDLMHFDRFSTGYKPIDGTSALAGRAIHKLRQVSSAVERWNRVSSATAAYNMAIAKGKSHDAAKEYVMDILSTTQGDFTRTGAPLLLKQLPKVVGQYKKFQLMMAAYYVKAFTSAFRGSTAEERAVGKRMLAFKLLHTAIASGVLGLPMMNVAQLIYGAFNDGPDDLETKGQELIGDKTLAQMLLHGIPSFTGLDMSAKLDDAQVFSLIPYSKLDLSSKTGVATTAAGLAGPWMSQAQRMATGLGLIQQGDMYKGAEKLMPKGLEMMMQSFRLANDGVTLKNGDVVVKPEDVSAFALLLTAAGLPSTEIKNITAQENTQYTITKYFTDKSKEIERQYLQAHRAKDMETMAELRAKWMELQKSKDAQREHFKQLPDVLKHQPLATLLNIPNSDRAREQKTQREFLNPS